MNILVTGGAGFIGSNFISYFLKKNKNINVINLDLLTYAGNLENLEQVEGNERYTFVKGDINDKELLEFLFTQYDIKGVIHFAAESHVDNSIYGPEAFILTNIVGTFNLLEAAKKHWMDGPYLQKKGYEECRFHHISTDEVYGSLGDIGYFTEESSYAPNSPYSASKASSDMLVRSYFHTYGMNVVITNCSNNYGPNQHQEKLIPTIVRKALALESIPIYGSGKNIRDWIYVEDHCRAVDLVYFKGEKGQSYAIGGRCEKTNLEVATIICQILDEEYPLNRVTSKIKTYKELIQFVHDRPGHDFRYAIDSAKIERELNFRLHENFMTGIRKTIKSYLKEIKIFNKM